MKLPPNFRELEIEWLSEALRETIANLAYPVGMGIGPQKRWCERAAKKLFERYAGMIEMASKQSV